MAPRSFLRTAVDGGRRRCPARGVLAAGTVAFVLAVAVAPRARGQSVLAWTVVAFGLVGLVARRDPGSALDRLADKVEQVEAGAYGVDLSTDREDAVGRLYEAVDSLSETLRERDRSLAEQRRRLGGERDRLSALFEGTTDCVARVELGDGVVVRDVNARFEEVFGYGGDAVGDESLVDLVVPAELLDGSEPFQRRVRDGEPVEGKVSRETVDGTREFLFRFVPVGNGGEQPAEGYALFTDVGRDGREREQRAFEDDRQELYEITSDPELDDDRRLRRLLELGREHLDVESALVSHVDLKAGRYEIEMASGSEDALPGPETGLSEMYCERTIESDELLGIYNAAEEGWEDHPSSDEMGIGCYLGGKLLVDDEIYGTLCFLDREPHETPFTREERAFADILTRATSYILERRERERELKRSVRQFEAVFGDPKMLVGLLDPDGTLRQVNQTAFEYVDVGPEAVVGKPFPETPWWKDTPADDVRRWIDRAASGEYVEYEAHLDDPDGIRRWVSGTFRPVTNEAGDVVSIVVSAHNITEQKQHEQQLREERDRFLTLFENLPNPIARGVHVDTEPVIELVNPAFEELFGVDAAEVRGQSLDDVVVPEDRREEADHINRRLFEEGSVSTEVRRSTASGLRDFQLDSVIRNPDADQPEGYSIWTDVTERKERERRLRERERQLQRYQEYTEKILEAIDDVFYLLDDDWTIQRWNSSLNELTGYTDEEIAETNALELFPEDDSVRIATALDDIEARVGNPLEVTILTKDGEPIPFELVAAPLEDPDGNRVVAGIGRDISERREKERELSRLVSNVPGFVYRARNEPDWPMEFVSEGVREIAGYDPDALERDEVSWGEDVIAEGNDALWEQVQRALEEGRPFNVIYPIETADGERRWVKEQGRGVYAADESLEALEGVVIDVTERIEYERELERTRKLLEQSQQLARVGAWEVDVRGEPYELTVTSEVNRIYERPIDAKFDLEQAVEFYHPDDRQQVRSAFDRAIEDGEEYDLEARLVTAEGNERWVRTLGEPVREDSEGRGPADDRTNSDDGEVVKIRGSIQDVTEQKERELALESLHDATRGLLGTETEGEVAELVVETAEDVLDVPGVGVYLLDEESNRLEPAAFTEGFAELCSGAPSVSAGGGDSVLWTTFVTGAPTAFDRGGVVDDSQLLGGAVDEGLVVPIGDHGVFVVVSPTPTIDEEVRRLVETLVATTEAAFDRLESETSLRERDAELETQNRRLRRQIQITDIIRRIDQSLIGAESREAIEVAVCERLAAADDVAFAWIGGYDGSGSRLVPRAWAGSDPDYLDEVSLADGTDAPEPAVAAARTEAPTVASNVVDRLKEEAWRKQALASGFHSVVSVPLTVDGYFYGVLAVYASEPGAFGELERSVFAELGENIANAIDAVKARQALHADTLVELTLQFEESDAFLARVASATGANVEYEELATHSAEGSRLFFTTTGVAPGEVEAALDDLVSVTDYRFITESDGERLFEATVRGEVLPSRLVRHGATPRSIRATETGLEVVVDVPATTDVREFVELLRDRYPDVELTGRRDVERATHTRQELVASLLDGLTNRQLEVLRTAYFAGFFEWPRESTGEDVAELLDVSQPTVNRHLRLAQGRLLEQLFEEGMPPPSTGRSGA